MGRNGGSLSSVVLIVILWSLVVAVIAVILLGHKQYRRDVEFRQNAEVRYSFTVKQGAMYKLTALCQNGEKTVTYYFRLLSVDETRDQYVFAYAFDTELDLDDVKSGTANVWKHTQLAVPECPETDPVLLFWDGNPTAKTAHIRINVRWKIEEVLAG